MLPDGRHPLGPDTATLQVRTSREGAYAGAGHDLVMDVKGWQGSLVVDGENVALELTVDPRSLLVRWGMNGVTQLTDKDRASISGTIDDKVLRAAPISFRSRSATPYGNSMMMSGDLTIGRSTRTMKFELRSNADGTRVDAIARVTQSEFGVKPYSAMLGALKVCDVVEIVATAKLPLWSPPVAWGADEVGRPLEAVPVEVVQAPVEVPAAREAEPAVAWMRPPQQPAAPARTPPALAGPALAAVAAERAEDPPVAAPSAPAVTTQTRPPATQSPWSGVRLRLPRS
jgi:polyisoprenoid-binding protein YceI